MSMGSDSGKIFHFDQVKLVYVLSLVVGLLSALAAALLKNAIHFTSILLTEGISHDSKSYLYLAYPFAGMLFTVIFVKFIIKDPISHGISRVLQAISRNRSVIKPHNIWSSMVASTLTIGTGGSVGA
jgi:CIC family chloride channel protein